MWLEIHVMKLYDLDGNVFSGELRMEIYVEVLDEFKKEHPEFIGSKFIYAAKKQATNETIQSCFETIRRWHKKFPTFLAGFDLVGQEDRAPKLVSFAEHILKLPSEIKLFFHAGETNWFGGIDENLVRTNIFHSILTIPNILLKIHFEKPFFFLLLYID